MTELSIGNASTSDLYHKLSKVLYESLKMKLAASLLLKGMRLGLGSN